MRRIARLSFVVTVAALISVSYAGAASAQIDNKPLPKYDAAQLVKEMGLKETDKPVRELIPGWKKPEKVMVSLDDNANRLAWWKEATPGVELLPVRTTEEAINAAPQADAIVGSGNLCNPKILRAAKKAKWAHFNRAGLQDCVFDPELQSGRIVVSNMQGVFANEIANTVMAYTLALARGLDGAMRYQIQGKWGRNVVPLNRLMELQDKTMLIVGLGGIGLNVAKDAHGLGMRVIATRNSKREKPDFVEYVGLADELPKLIGEADVVVNATPLTQATTGLFNKEMFARMKPTAYFISVGRGKSTVTQDLIDALKNGTIAGAGLDVTDPEPLPDGHPLFYAPNVIITPHMATAGGGSRGPRSWEVQRENLRRYIAGEKIFNVIDVKAGY